MQTVATALLERLGPEIVVRQDQIQPRYLEDWALNSTESPAALVLPRDTAQVSLAAHICNELKCPIVAQGGRTGLAGGATPGRGWCILSTERMTQVSEPELASSTLEAQAGAPLQRVQEAADRAGLLFPIDIGSRGSCTVGGNISTNAGGNRVLRYGMMRDMVLGLEVVLADGTVISSMNKMLKNNAGYDLKQLFIGSEGTLGIVTKAVLRLFPKPASIQTALAAVSDYQQILSLLSRARARLGPSLGAFEVMWPQFYRLATQKVNRRSPLDPGAGAYVLIESLGTDPHQDSVQFEDLLASAAALGEVNDAVIARSGREREEIWSIRDASGEFQKTFWPYVGYDVSLPIADIGQFVDTCCAKIVARWPDAQLVIFGHVADSNIHVCVRSESAGSAQPELEMNQVVYECVGALGGSISAEHGIGLLKKRYLHHSRSADELAVMQRLKRSLDPNNILNPGKIFDIERRGAC